MPWYTYGNAMPCSEQIQAKRYTCMSPTSHGWGAGRRWGGPCSTRSAARSGCRPRPQSPCAACSGTAGWLPQTEQPARWACRPWSQQTLHPGGTQRKALDKPRASGTFHDLPHELGSHLDGSAHDRVCTSYSCTAHPSSGEMAAGCVDDSLSQREAGRAPAWWCAGSSGCGPGS